jgi:nuclease S1
MTRPSRLPALLLLIPTAGLAWSEPGHRVIAEIAERQLGTEVRAEVLDLLATEQVDSLADIASWADRIRDRPEYAWSGRMHFVNLAQDCSYDAARDCPDGRCVVGAIERFRDELADRALPTERRAEALKFLVHFAGDVHQPLHAGFAHDLGGNRHQLSLDGHGTNLHAVWDREVPGAADLEPAAQAARLLQNPLPAAGTLDPAEWARASCRIIATDAIYPGDRKIGRPYLEHHLPRAESQLVLAGVRLAAVIEQALAP